MDYVIVFSHPDTLQTAQIPPPDRPSPWELIWKKGFLGENGSSLSPPGVLLTILLKYFNLL